MTPNYLYVMVLLQKRVLLLTFILFVGHDITVEKLIEEDEVNVHCLGFALLSHVVSWSSSAMVCD